MIKEKRIVKPKFFTRRRSCGELRQLWLEEWWQGEGGWWILMVGTWELRFDSCCGDVGFGSVENAFYQRKSFRERKRRERVI